MNTHIWVWSLPWLTRNIEKMTTPIVMPRYIASRVGTSTYATMQDHFKNQEEPVSSHEQHPTEPTMNLQWGMHNNVDL